MTTDARLRGPEGKILAESTEPCMGKVASMRNLPRNVPLNLEVTVKVSTLSPRPAREKYFAGQQNFVFAGQLVRLWITLQKVAPAPNSPQGDPNPQPCRDPNRDLNARLVDCSAQIMAAGISLMAPLELPATWAENSTHSILHIFLGGEQKYSLPYYDALPGIKTLLDKGQPFCALVTGPSATPILLKPGTLGPLVAVRYEVPINQLAGSAGMFFTLSGPSADSIGSVLCFNGSGGEKNSQYATVGDFYDAFGSLLRIGAPEVATPAPPQQQTPESVAIRSIIPGEELIRCSYNTQPDNRGWGGNLTANGENDCLRICSENANHARKVRNDNTAFYCLTSKDNYGAPIGYFAPTELPAATTTTVAGSSVTPFYVTLSVRDVSNYLFSYMSLSTPSPHLFYSDASTTIQHVYAKLTPELDEKIQTALRGFLSKRNGVITTAVRSCDFSNSMTYIGFWPLTKPFPSNREIGLEINSTAGIATDFASRADYIPVDFKSDTGGRLCNAVSYDGLEELRSALAAALSL